MSDRKATNDAPPAAPKRRIRWANISLTAYTWLVIIWLAFPIIGMIAFSFNKPQGRYNTKWRQFSFDAYTNIFAFQDLKEALLNSLLIAGATVLGAGALGTLIGVALGRYRFRGQGAANLVLFAVIAAPELVMGASLLSLFVQMNLGFGLLTIGIAHIMFSISFVAVVVRARVLTIDRSIEEAARDLGAGPWSTFWLVTFPMIFPAILSGALLAFALSIDDFVITNFTAGVQVQTFPLWIWGATRQGLPPQVNAMGTLIFLVGLLVAIGSAVSSYRKKSA